MPIVNAAGIKAARAWLRPADFQRIDVRWLGDVLERDWPRSVTVNSSLPFTVLR